jgi:hypothetical protein
MFFIGEVHENHAVLFFWGGGISIEGEREYDFLPKYRSHGDNTLLIKVKHALQEKS